MRTIGRWEREIFVGNRFALSFRHDGKHVKYPSVKSLGLRSTTTITKAIIAALFSGSF
jgi:hypothetical protein